MGGSESSEKKPAEAQQAVAATRPAASSQQKVVLNVYSTTGSASGIYHSGVELMGAEYVFGGGDTSYSGVTAQRPKVPPSGSGWVFYQPVEVGALRMSRDEAMRVVNELKADFPARSYDLVSRNCNHFSDALCQRLCGQGIPGWVNRLAGVGSTLRSAVGAGPDAAAAAAGAGKAEGSGGPAAIGLVAQAADADGGLGNMVDWGSCGALNAKEDDAAAALRDAQGVHSEDGCELLLQIPFTSPVKLQSLVLEAPDASQAPVRARLFANHRNLDMDDALQNVAPTQEVAKLTWGAPRADGVVAATIEVNFLKFQNLGFLAVYVSREEEDGSFPDESPVAIQSLRLLGRV